jgi:hypothetical protein
MRARPDVRARPGACSRISVSLRRSPPPVPLRITRSRCAEADDERSKEESHCFRHVENTYRGATANDRNTCVRCASTSDAPPARRQVRCVGQAELPSYDGAERGPDADARTSFCTTRRTTARAVRVERRPDGGPAHGPSPPSRSGVEPLVRMNGGEWHRRFGARQPVESASSFRPGRPDGSAPELGRAAPTSERPERVGRGTDDVLDNTASKKDPHPTKCVQDGDPP